MAEYVNRYPPAHSDQYVKASSRYSDTYWPYFATNPAGALNGWSVNNNSWYSAAGAALPQKFAIYFGTAVRISRLIINNSHSGGEYIASGLKTFRVYGGNDFVAFANITDVTDLTGLTLLGEFTARQHVAQDIADPQVFDVNASGTYSYLVLTPIDSWGVYNYIGFRRIEVQEAIGPTTVLIGAELSAPYRAAWMTGAELGAIYQATVPIGSGLEASYRGLQRIGGELAALYRAKDCQLVGGELDAPYQSTDTSLVGGELAASYRGDDPAPVDDGLKVLLAGQTVDPIRINITMSRQQSVIDCELEVAEEEVYRLAARHAPARVRLWGYEFELIVDGRSRREAFGEHTYTIRLVSPAARLEAPWAAKIEGELTGLASALARQLAGSVPLNWQAVDWYILPGVWIAASQSPLELLQSLVSAVGATFCSQPDGSLLVQPLYPQPLPEWSTATPSRSILAANEVFVLESSGEHRDGIDAITVSDQQAASDGLRIEEDSERKSGGLTQVLVYQTPWQDDFTLTHRGGDTAHITPMGIEERVILDEEIIVQDGEANTRYPIYAVLAARYNRLVLGTPTYSEDGRVSTAIKGESILILNYRTRARRYQVRESTLADLLLVAASGEDI